MTDVVGNPEEERRAEYFYKPWTNEGVNRYFYTLVSIMILNNCFGVNKMQPWDWFFPKTFPSMKEIKKHCALILMFIYHLTIFEQCGVYKSFTT